MSLAAREEAPVAPLGMASATGSWRCRPPRQLLLVLLLVLSIASYGAAAIKSGAGESRAAVQVAMEERIRSFEVESEEVSEAVSEESRLGHPHAATASSSSNRLAAAAAASSSSSSSVLAALLDSEHQQMLELLDKAGILQPLESLVATEPLTILAANLEACEPGFKRWLLEPANLRHLQKLLQHHVVMGDVPAWSASFSVLPLSEEPIALHRREDASGRRRMFAERVEVVAPDAIVRSDGRVHGLRHLLVPRSVRQAYALYKRYGTVLSDPDLSPPPPAFLPFPVYSDGPAAAPGLAPAYAPAPGPSGPVVGPFLGSVEEEVHSFVAALAHYGGYADLADLIANLTSLAADLALLVESGARFTLLAPDDQALARHLGPRQLGAAGAAADLDNILWYHVVPDYLTEEAVYNAVRRRPAHLPTLAYPTLRRAPDGRVYTVQARELDGTVQFGQGKHVALALDHDIFADGRISVIGINNVLFPPGAEPTAALAPAPAAPGVGGASRGRSLFEDYLPAGLLQLQQLDPHLADLGLLLNSQRNAATATAGQSAAGWLTLLAAASAAAVKILLGA